MRINCLVPFAFFVAASPAAFAGLVTLSLQNGNGGGGAFNTTQFSITNNSDAGVSLTSATFTVGDTQYLFDQLYLSEELFTGGNATQTALLTTGDRTDDNAGPDSFAYSFTNFTPGISFRGQWDIDNDNGDFNADTRTVMFNNGTAPNAIATFAFSDGSTLSYEFPDLPIQDSYTLVIPAPATAGMLVVAGFAGLRRRRSCL
jgi:hypothetical protein